MIVLGGVGFAALALWRRRDAVLLAVTAASIVFVAKVEVDWMPNVRYWLALWVTLPMIWLWAADRVWMKSRALASIAVIVLLGTMVHQVQIDMRYSVFSYRSRGSKAWTKPKTAAVNNTWACLSHEWPASVLKNDGFNMGMITQTFRLRSNRMRVRWETWFIGPDIGLIGWVTPVNIWEPPGCSRPTCASAARSGSATARSPPALARRTRSARRHDRAVR